MYDCVSDNGGKLRLALSALLLLLIVAGCGEANGGGALLRDRFGDPNSGWGSESQEAFDRGYQDGRYFIELYEPNWLTWARPGEQFADVVIETEAQPVSGVRDGHFGVLCRYHGRDNFYYFAVTADGYYAILRVKNGEPELLTGDGFRLSPYILTDGEQNSIQAVCQGERLTLRVNGEEVATATDEAFRRGDVGLAVGSGPAGEIRVHFDNFLVIAPNGQEVEEEEE